MKLSTELKNALNNISCNGWWECPGSEGNRIYNMRTCTNCAAIIQLKRIVKKLEDKGK